MADTRTDREILQGGTVTVSLCGKSYEFKEPGRRQGRAMLCEVLEIQPLLASTEPASRLRGIDKCLDWLYHWHPEIKRDREAIDNGADEQEIGLAFRAVVDMVNVPFLALAARMKEQAQADQHEDAPTDTPNPAP